MRTEGEAASRFGEMVITSRYDLAEAEAIIWTTRALSYIAEKTAMAPKIKTDRRNFRLTSDKLNPDDVEKPQEALFKNNSMSCGRGGIRQIEQD